MQMQEEQPDVVTAIITQLSLKPVLEEWVTKDHNNVHYDMKQLKFLGTFKPMHWIEQEDTQRNSML